MFRKTIIALLIPVISLLLFSCGGKSEEGEKAPLSPGLEVLSAELELNKCGLKGNDVRFEKEDFDVCLGVRVSSVTLSSVPDPRDGVLRLGNDALSAGDVVSRSDLDNLVFSPSGKNATGASFGFFPSGASFTLPVSANVYLLKAVNSPPEISVKGAAEKGTVCLKNIAVYDRLYASDPDGDGIVFEISALPKHGTVGFTDKSNGVFRYIPAEDHTGKDTFSFRVSDVYGNRSEEKECVVTTERVKDDLFFADMINDPDHASAVRLVNGKIMKSSLRDGKTVFLPGKEITRAEFLSYVAKIKGGISDIPSDVFCDMGDVPASLLPYVGYAASKGWTSGAFENGKRYLDPNSKITAGEAAAILNNAFGISDAVPTSAFVKNENVPAFAEDVVSVMKEKGFFEREVEARDVLTKKVCASILSKFYED